MTGEKSWIGFLPIIPIGGRGRNNKLNLTRDRIVVPIFKELKKELIQACEKSKQLCSPPKKEKKIKNISEVKIERKTLKGVRRSLNAATSVQSSSSQIVSVSHNNSSTTNPTTVSLFSTKPCTTTSSVVSSNTRCVDSNSYFSTTVNLSDETDKLALHIDSLLATNKIASHVETLMKKKSAEHSNVVESKRNDIKQVDCKTLVPQRKTLVPQRKTLVPQRKTLVPQGKSSVLQCKSEISDVKVNSVTSEEAEKVIKRTKITPIATLDLTFSKTLQDKNPKTINNGRKYLEENRAAMKTQNEEKASKKLQNIEDVSDNIEKVTKSTQEEKVQIDSTLSALAAHIQSVVQGETKVEKKYLPPKQLKSKGPKLVIQDVFINDNKKKNSSSPAVVSMTNEDLKLNDVDYLKTLDELDSIVILENVAAGTHKELEEMLSSYGSIILFITEEDGPKHLVGFLKMSDSAECDFVVSCLDGYEWKKSRLRVRKAADIVG